MQHKKSNNHVLKLVLMVMNDSDFVYKTVMRLTIPRPTKHIKLTFERPFNNDKKDGSGVKSYVICCNFNIIVWVNKCKHISLR